MDKIHQTFQTDLEAEKKRVEALQGIATELRFVTCIVTCVLHIYTLLSCSSLNYSDSEGVNSRLSALETAMSELQEASDNRKQRIDVCVINKFLHT